MAAASGVLAWRMLANVAEDGVVTRAGAAVARA
jgi:hypothetical protein